MSIPATLVPPPLPTYPLAAACALVVPLLLGVALSALAQQPHTLRYRVPLFVLVELSCWRALGGYPLDGAAARVIFNMLNLTHVLGIVFAPRLLLSQPYTLRAPSDPAAPHPIGVVASLRQGLRFLMDAQGSDFAPLPPFFVPCAPSAMNPADGPPLSAGQHLGGALCNCAAASAIMLVVHTFFPSFIAVDFTLRRPLEDPIPLVPRRWQPLPRFLTQYLCSLTLGLFLMLFLVRAGAHTLAFFAITIGGMDPHGYDEPADRPWTADSIHTFWKDRWHRYLLPTMRFYGALLPSAFAPVAAFAVTAVLHDVYLLPAVAHPAWPHLSPITLYFLLQPAGMLLERLFSRAMGRRVRGSIGRLWVAVWFTSTSPLFTDAVCHAVATPGLPKGEGAGGC